MHSKLFLNFTEGATYQMHASLAKVAPHFFQNRFRAGGQEDGCESNQKAIASRKDAAGPGFTMKARVPTGQRMQHGVHEGNLERLANAADFAFRIGTQPFVPDFNRVELSSYSIQYLFLCNIERRRP